MLNKIYNEDCNIGIKKINSIDNKENLEKSVKENVERKIDKT